QERSLRHRHPPPAVHARRSQGPSRADRAQSGRHLLPGSSPWLSLFSLRQTGFELSQQLLRFEWAKEESHGTQSETFGTRHLVAVGRSDEYERDMFQPRICFDGFDEVKPVSVRHVQVVYDEIGQRHARLFLRLRHAISIK